MGEERASKIDPALAFDIRKDSSKEFAVWIKTLQHPTKGQRSYLTRLGVKSEGRQTSFFTAELMGEKVLNLDHILWIEWVRFSRKLPLRNFENYLPK